MYCSSSFHFSFCPSGKTDPCPRIYQSPGAVSTTSSSARQASSCCQSLHQPPYSTLHPLPLLHSLLPPELFNLRSHLFHLLILGLRASFLLHHSRMTILMTTPGFRRRCLSVLPCSPCRDVRVASSASATRRDISLGTELANPLPFARQL